MPCIVALIVLAFLSIFSVKYRAFAKEAFDCVFRRLTLRPCQTGFDLKVKTTVSSWFLKRSEKIGGFVFRRFEILNWIFVVLSLATLVYVGRGVYFYVKYGSCDPQNPQTCVINRVTDAITSTSTEECVPEEMKEAILRMQQ